MISSELLDYLEEFLLGAIYQCDDTHCRRSFRLIHYTDKPEAVQTAGVVIKASKFFHWGHYGTPEAEPQLPLAQWQGIPLLFGEPRQEWLNEGRTFVIHADLIASSYYLMSRYEEMTHRGVRDGYGRFPGRQSLPYRAGFLHRPIVDEYGAALRRLLQEQGVMDKLGLIFANERTGFSRINLSLDVREPFRYRGLSGLIRGLFVDRMSPLKLLRALFFAPHEDPYYTFNTIFKAHRQLQDRYPDGLVRTMLFLKVPTRLREDQPRYHLSKPYMYQVLREADALGAYLGLLVSHVASQNPHRIPDELKRLRHCLKKVYRRLYHWHNSWEDKGRGERIACKRDLELTRSRHASLAFGEPEDARELLAAGIRHDYSMGYADVAGFRLGTSRPLRFIHPNTRSLTDLVLHPLTVMDRTLSDTDKMNLTEEDAYHYATALIDQVRRYGGELNLLWHNEQLAPGKSAYQASLYKRLLSHLNPS